MAKYQCIIFMQREDEVNKCEQILDLSDSEGLIGYLRKWDYDIGEEIEDPFGTHDTLIYREDLVLVIGPSHLYFGLYRKMEE